MAKVAKQTTLAGAGATVALPRSETPDTNLTAIYAIVGEFVCGASETERSRGCSTKGRVQRIMEITAEASGRLDELEVRIFAHPDPPIKTEQTARSRRLAERAAIRTAHDLLTRQFGRVQHKERVGVRIMDTVMGWVFVVGLIVWTYVSRLIGLNKSHRAARKAS